MLIRYCTFPLFFFVNLSQYLIVLWLPTDNFIMLDIIKLSDNKGRHSGLKSNPV